METKDLSDEQLIEIIREKDKELYLEIIKRYKQKLSHYLQKFTKDRDELEDILQTVFLKTYQNLYGFDVNRKFSSWIYRIAHNEALNYIKKNRNQINLDDVEFLILDKKADIIEGIEAKETQVMVKIALDNLKNKYRDPLILYYFEEKSYEEISDILRINKNTVGTLIMRGKKQIKEFLKKEYETKTRK